MGILSYNEKGFTMDGEEFTILSGAMHYFRIVPEYWEDRLKKLKACGFNTVETVTCWNLHEPKEGEFNFSGILDLEKYIGTAKALGLYALLSKGNLHGKRGMRYLCPSGRVYERECLHKRI